MSLTYKLNRTCPVCGKLINDKNKSGYCNKHRDRTGANNSFFGKHHSKETVEQIKKTCAIRSHELWQNDEYRTHVIENATGLKRSDEFKEFIQNFSAHLWTFCKFSWFRSHLESYLVKCRKRREG